MIQRDGRPVVTVYPYGDHLPHRLAWHDLAFIAALLVYLLVRLVKLADYPIYFFTDEAMQTMLAADRKSVV